MKREQITERTWSVQDCWYLTSSSLIRWSSLSCFWQECNQVTLDKPRLAVPAWEWILTILIGILGLVQQVTIVILKGVLVVLVIVVFISTSSVLPGLGGPARISGKSDRCPKPPDHTCLRRSGHLHPDPDHWQHHWKHLRQLLTVNWSWTRLWCLVKFRC